MLKARKFTKEQAEKLYYEMYLYRRFEEKAAQFYNVKKIAGFCHLYIGQEAVATGIQYFATEKDTFITTYRDHVHALISGLSPFSVMAELFGKKEGCMGGKGGSMHIYNKEGNFFGGHGIVGSSVPLGTGFAFKHKYSKDGGVSISYVGDGAVNQGQVAEAFNMASLWKLPVIYVIENNQYAMGTSVARSRANTEFDSVGVPYNIKAIKVDGMNLIDVMDKAEAAFKYVRSGNGPIILDVWTYRYRGHSMSDPAKYRDRSEVDSIKEARDPIKTFASYIISKKLVTQDKIKEIEKTVESELKEMEKSLANTTEPDINELYTHVQI